MIFHLVWEAEWQAAGDPYSPGSLQTEGFVHATKEPEKVVEVANLFYADPNAGRLLLLTLEETRIPAPIKYEDPGVGWLFPHIYGPIPHAAVVSTEPMVRTEQEWRLPDSFEQ